MKRILPIVALFAIVGGVCLTGCEEKKADPAKVPEKAKEAVKEGAEKAKEAAPAMPKP